MKITFIKSEHSFSIEVDNIPRIKDFVRIRNPELKTVFLGTVTEVHWEYVQLKADYLDKNIQSYVEVYLE